jgi:hypothetical protein
MSAGTLSPLAPRPSLCYAVMSQMQRIPVFTPPAENACQGNAATFYSKEIAVRDKTRHSLYSAIYDFTISETS